MRQDRPDGLIAFIVAAEERGFSAAAIRLDATPSAVSQSIRSLEQREPHFIEAGARYLARVHCVR